MSMRALRAAVPALCVVVVVLLSAMPWGLPPQARFLMPLLPLAVIHRWALVRPELMPEWLVFLCGLAVDVSTHGPLGFWSLVYLLGLVPVRLTEASAGKSALFAWVHFCATVAGLAVVQWLLASMFFIDAVEWQPFAVGALGMMSAYPLIDLMLRPMLRIWPESGNARFERGG